MAATRDPSTTYTGYKIRQPIISPNFNHSKIRQIAAIASILAVASLTAFSIAYSSPALAIAAACVALGGILFVRVESHKIQIESHKTQRIKDLFTAITNNDLSAIKNLVERGVNVNSTLGGTSALYQAVEWARINKTLEIIKFLIDQNVNIDEDIWDNIKYRMKALIETNKEPIQIDPPLQGHANILLKIKLEQMIFESQLHLLIVKKLLKDSPKYFSSTESQEALSMVEQHDSAMKTTAEQLGIKTDEILESNF